MTVKKPPMGYNSWDCYGASVREEEIISIADYMRDNLLEYGWEYVVVDIQWYEPEAVSNEYRKGAPLVMDEYSRLMPAVNRFPSAADGRGFTALAEKIHSMGLKFGIHILRGIPRQAVRENTKIFGSDVTAPQIADVGSICSWNDDMCGVDMTRDGAQQYYDSIIGMYAGWGVDLLKIDDILRPYHSDEIEAIESAVRKTGRDIVISLSPGAAPVNRAGHLQKHADMWRMTDDFWDSYDMLKAMFDYCRRWFPYTGSGCWADCDMLPLGRIGIRSLGGDRMTRFTHDEQKTMMTLWSIFRSPLMMGGDVRYNDDFTSSLMQNRELISINQNSRAGREVYRRGDEIVWTANAEDDSKYLARFNVGEEMITSDFDFAFIGEKNIKHARELWDREEFDIENNKITSAIKPHGVKLYKVSR